MIRKADNVITGYDGKGFYFYYSRVSGYNIVRRHTSLTGARVKKDPAFKGFRESGNRMKEASPIAAALYKMVLPEVKQFALYRLLTGEALKMLKGGKDSVTIAKSLKQSHIDPLLREPPVRERIHEEKIRPGNDDTKPGRLADITRYFPIDSASTRKSRIRRHRQMERMVNQLPAQGGNGQQNVSNLLRSETTPLSDEMTPSSEQRMSITDNTQIASREQVSKPSTKYPGLMYRCRLRECKKLKLWIRSSCFPGTGG